MSNFKEVDTMATAKKLPSGAYRCLIFDRMEDGKRKYKSFTAPTKKEAEYLATQYIMTKEEDKKKPQSKSLFSEELVNILLPRKLCSHLPRSGAIGTYKEC